MQAEIPVWVVAGIGGIWISLILWQLLGRRAIEISGDRRRISRILASGDQVAVPSSNLEQELHQAGISLSATTFNLLRLIGSAAIIVLSLALNLPPILGIGGSIAVFFGLRLWLKGKASSRGRKMEEDLPSALARIAALVDIEKDMASLLNTVADTITATNPTSPLAAELRRTAGELRSRGPAALADLEQRSPSPAVATMAFNLRVFMESGGEYSKLMAEAAERMQRIIEGRRAARSKAASALTLAKLFPVLFLGVSLITFQDPGISAFYRSAPGQILLLLIAGIMALGYMIIQKMVENVA